MATAADVHAEMSRLPLTHAQIVLEAVVMDEPHLGAGVVIRTLRRWRLMASGCVGSRHHSVYYFGKHLVHGASRWALAGATASVDGTSTERSSAGRTVGGALLGGFLAGVAGGVVGAVAGSGAKKDTSKRFLTVTTTDGVVSIPFPPAVETQARNFAARINSWGR